MSDSYVKLVSLVQRWHGLKRHSMLTTSHLVTTLGYVKISLPCLMWNTHELAVIEMQECAET